MPTEKRHVNYNISNNNGIVMIHNMVDNNTIFADISCSVWWSSASERIIAADGTELNTRIEALNG